MPIGLFDLSLVTKTLTDQLNDAKDNSRLWEDPKVRAFNFDYVGLAPDAVRSTMDDDGFDCRVSVYLFHVTVDKHHRNTYPLGGPAQATPPQPLALTLYYLLTAYSPTSHDQEQQAMSIALKSLHETPVVSLKIPVEKHEEAFTLTIEPQTVDEVGRLWQAINAPMRLSAVYRVGVVFLAEPVPEPPKVVRHDPGFLDWPKPQQPDRNQIQAVTTVPGVERAVADATGLARIELPGARLDAKRTEVKIRARSLTRVNDAPLGGEFQVLMATTVPPRPDTLVLRLPLYTPEGRYLITVAPSPDEPPLTFSLEVPARVVFARIGQDKRAAFAIDDADFASPGTEVLLYLRPSAPTPLKLSTIDLPNEGDYFVFPETNALRLRVPASTDTGIYSLVVKRGADLPAFHLWLELPS